MDYSNYFDTCPEDYKSGILSSFQKLNQEIRGYEDLAPYRPFIDFYAALYNAHPGQPTNEFVKSLDRNFLKEVSLNYFDINKIKQTCSLTKNYMNEITNKAAKEFGEHFYDDVDVEVTRNLRTNESINYLSPETKFQSHYSVLKRIKADDLKKAALMEYFNEAVAIGDSMDQYNNAIDNGNRDEYKRVMDKMLELEYKIVDEKRVTIESITENQTNTRGAQTPIACKQYYKAQGFIEQSAAAKDFLTKTGLDLDSVFSNPAVVLDNIGKVIGSDLRSVADQRYPGASTMDKAIASLIDPLVSTSVAINLRNANTLINLSLNATDDKLGFNTLGQRNAHVLQSINDVQSSIANDGESLKRMVSDLISMKDPEDAFTIYNIPAVDAPQVQRETDTFELYKNVMRVKAALHDTVNISLANDGTLSDASVYDFDAVIVEQSQKIRDKLTIGDFFKHPINFIGVSNKNRQIVNEYNKKAKVHNVNLTKLAFKRPAIMTKRQLAKVEKEKAIALRQVPEKFRAVYGAKFVQMAGAKLLEPAIDVAESAKFLFAEDYVNRMIQENIPEGFIKALADSVKKNGIDFSQPNMAKFFKPSFEQFQAYSDLYSERLQSLTSNRNAHLLPLYKELMRTNANKLNNEFIKDGFLPPCFFSGAQNIDADLSSDFNKLQAELQKEYDRREIIDKDSELLYDKIIDSLNRAIEKPEELHNLFVNDLEKAALVGGSIKDKIMSALKSNSISGLDEIALFKATSPKDIDNLLDHSQIKQFVSSELTKEAAKVKSNAFYEELVPKIIEKGNAMDFSQTVEVTDMTKVVKNVLNVNYHAIDFANNVLADSINNMVTDKNQQGKLEQLISSNMEGYVNRRKNAYRDSNTYELNKLMKDVADNKKVDMESVAKKLVSNHDKSKQDGIKLLASDKPVYVKSEADALNFVTAVKQFAEINKQAIKNASKVPANNFNSPESILEKVALTNGNAQIKDVIKNAFAPQAKKKADFSKLLEESGHPKVKPLQQTEVNKEAPTVNQPTLK